MTSVSPSLLTAGLLLAALGSACDDPAPLTIEFLTSRCVCQSRDWCGCIQLEDVRIWLLKVEDRAGTGGWCRLRHEQKRNVTNIFFDEGIFPDQGPAAPIGKETTLYDVDVARGDALALALAVRCAPMDTSMDVGACCRTINKARNFDMVSDFSTVQEECGRSCPACSIDWAAPDVRNEVDSFYEKECLALRCAGYKDFRMEPGTLVSIEVRKVISGQNPDIQRAESAPACDER